VFGIGANVFEIRANVFEIGLNEFEIAANVHEIAANVFEIGANVYEIMPNVHEIGLNEFGIGANVFEIVANVFGITPTPPATSAFVASLYMPVDGCTGFVLVFGNAKVNWRGAMFFCKIGLSVNGQLLQTHDNDIFNPNQPDSSSYHGNWPTVRPAHRACASFA